jgi:hypothetical protein
MAEADDLAAEQQAQEQALSTASAAARTALWQRQDANMQQLREAELEPLQESVREMKRLLAFEASAWEAGSREQREELARMEEGAEREARLIARQAKQLKRLRVRCKLCVCRCWWVGDGRLGLGMGAWGEGVGLE